MGCARVCDKVCIGRGGCAGIKDSREFCYGIETGIDGDSACVNSSSVMNDIVRCIDVVRTITNACVRETKPDDIAIDIICRRCSGFQVKVYRIIG